jgi:hypothetical protein
MLPGRFACARCFVARNDQLREPPHGCVFVRIEEPGLVDAAAFLFLFSGMIVDVLGRIERHSGQGYGHRDVP